MNFEAEKPDRVEVDPNSVLEPGRVTWWERLPTVVASGITSWSTREVVQDEWGQVGPLKIGEMEKAMGYDVGYTYAEGISMRERYRLIGNAFHAGVMRHLLCCYISSVAMKGVVLRDDVRQSGVPFTMNQDGPEGGLCMCEGLGQTSEAGMCEGLWLEPQPSQGGCPMEFFRDGGLAAGKKKTEEPARSKAVVRIKIEGEDLPKKKKGKG